MRGLLQDVRYALRQLSKNPGFTLVAVLTLAIGIGANTAIYGVIEAVLLRQLPFGTPDRLVWLNGKFPQSDEAGVSPPDFLDYRTSNRAFDRLAAMGYAPGPANLTGISIAVALPASLLLAHAIRNQLFGIPSSDPLTLALGTGVVVLVALVSAFFPARRAAKVDPMVALRYE